jgi:subtilisin
LTGLYSRHDNIALVLLGGRVKRLLLVLLIGCALALAEGGVAAEPVASVRVILTFHQPPGASQQMLVRDLGGVIRHRYHLMPAIAAELPPGALASLWAAPAVAMVEEDQLVKAVDTELDDSWGVKHIGAGEVHPTNSGEGVKVAILDTGIDYGHPDLDDNYLGGYDFVNEDTDPFDDHGHGTLVAGVLAAEDNGSGVVGVAPRAQLYALKVLDDTGTGWLSDILLALDWAVLHDMDVANMSFGSLGYSAIYQTAITNAYQAGLVLVAAAGNGETCPPAGEPVLYPAEFADVIAAAATDQEDARACFSRTGSAVELAAPGKYIRTTYLGGIYALASGTSLATPHVAGAAALVLASGISDANGNGRVNDDVRLWLQETADDLGPAGRDTWYGFGLVNVRSLVDSSVDSDGDEFSDEAEFYIGTDPFDACPDDPFDSAWPLDMNNDALLNLGGDVFNYSGKVGCNVATNPECQRLDLNGDGLINLGGDVVLYLGKIGDTCS